MVDYLKLANEVEDEKAAETGLSNYDAIAKDLEEEEKKKSQIDIGINMDQEGNPDIEAKVYDLSRKTQTPPDLTRDRLREIERRQTILEMDLPKQIKDYPVVSEELKNPEVARFIHDDVAQLNKFERLVKDVGQKLNLGYDRKNLTKLNWALMHENGDAKTLAERDATLNRLNGATDYRLGWAGEIPGMVAEEMTEDIAMSIDIYRRSGGTANIATMTALTSFEAETANAWMELATATDENGLKIDNGAARIGAYIVGLGATALEVVPFSKMLRTIPGSETILGKISAQSMKQMLKVPSLRKAFTRIARNWGEAAVTEAIQEGLTELITLGAGETLGYEGESPLDQQAAMLGSSKVLVAGSRTLESMDEGLRVAFGMATPGTVASMIAESVHVRNALKRADMYREMGKAAQESKTRERLPGKFQEIIKNINEHYGAIKDVYIDIDVLNKFFQETGVTPDMLAESMPGLSERMNNAIEFSTQIAIPLDEFATYIAGSESFEALANDIRPHPEALSANEAMQMQQEHAEMQEVWKNLQEREDQAAEVNDFIYEDMRIQLEQAGQAPDIADKQATLYATTIPIMAEKLKIDPVEYYKSINLSIVSDIAQEPGREEITPLDSALNSVREGAYPSQNEMFGDSLIQYIRSSGGIADEGGELSAMDLGGRGGMINKKGRNLADFTEMARDAGYGDMSENE